MTLIVGGVVNALSANVARGFSISAVALSPSNQVAPTVELL